jgi:hypothetical protein
LGEKEKANAHLKRGLEYTKLAKFSFGTGSEVPSGSSGTGPTAATTGDGRVGGTDQINIEQVRESVRALLRDSIAKVEALDGLIKNAELEMLCSLLVTKLSPGYDAAALMAAALVWNKRWKGTTLNNHRDVRRTIEGVLGGTGVFTGAYFGEMKELFVFTDVSLRSSDGNPKGDIDDKFALCLLAHAARDSQLERIVVVISARQKDDNDTTMPIDVAELFTEKIGHQDTNQEVQGTDESLLNVTYQFTNKKPSRKDLSLVVCFDHGIKHLRPDYASVKTFDDIMKPKSEQAVAVVIGPISVHTARKLEEGSRDGKYKLVAGVSVTGGVNGGDSKINKRFKDDQDAWVLACAGGRELKNMFELTTGDTRRLLMTLPFLAMHNIASIEEVKQAHMSVWRNHLGFYNEAKPDMAFRILASNSQTTSALGTDSAAICMGWFFEEVRGTSDMLLPDDTVLFEKTGMSGLIKANPHYLEIAKRYVAWCFANLYLHLVPDDKYRQEVVRYMEPNSHGGVSVLPVIDISTIRNMAASMADTKDEKKHEIIPRVIKDVGGGDPGDKGIAVDLWAVYIASIAATYMRLLSTEILLNKVDLVDRITWTCTTEPDLDVKKKPTGLYKLVPYNGKNILSVV